MNMFCQRMTISSRVALKLLSLRLMQPMGWELLISWICSL